MKTESHEIARHLTNLLWFSVWAQRPKESRDEKHKSLKRIVDTVYKGDPTLHLIVDSIFSLDLDKYDI